jgi:hypothetical protein
MRCATLNDAPHVIEDEKQQIYLHRGQCLIRPEITKVRASTLSYQLPLIGT